MIQKESVVVIADNSGGKKAKCIGIKGGTNKKTATVGDIITVSVGKTISKSKVAKGSVCSAVIVRMKSSLRRSDGSVIRADENAVVLLNAQGDSIGSRVFGPIYREIKSKGFVKIISWAEEVV